MAKRTGWLVLPLLLALPLALDAQQGKPSNNMWTRSAANYLREAERTTGDARKAVYEKALEQALQSTQKEPANPMGFLLAGQTYLGLGDLAKADEMLDRAERLYPEYAKETTPIREKAWIEHYNAAVGAIQAGRMAEAVPHLEMADAIYQGRPTARLTLASLYQNQEQVDRAIAAYRGVLEMAASPAAKSAPADQRAAWKEAEERALSQLGQLYMFARRFAEAEEFYRSYLAAHPEDAQARLSLATALSRGGKKEEAARVFAELANRQGLDDVAYFNIGVGLYQAGQHQGAEAAFRKAMAANPHNRDVAFNLAQAIYTRLREEPSGTQAERAKLAPAYTEVGRLAAQVTAADPANATALRLAAIAMQVQAAAAPDPKVRLDMARQAEALNKRAETLPFEVVDVRMTEAKDEVRVTGAVRNLGLAPGSRVRLRFTVLGRDGAAAGSQEVEVAAPAKDARESFSLAVPAKGAAGWRYELVQ